MSNNLIVTEPVPPEKFVATLENVGAELARITASLAQALTLPPLDALQQLRKTERRAEWLHHGVRSAARSARFYLVWQNRFARRPLTATPAAPSPAPVTVADGILMAAIGRHRKSFTMN